MSTIFSKIVAGEIPSHRVWEDDEYYAFLDIRPVQPGHTLVIPKREVDYLFDLDEDEYAGLWKAVRTVEAKLKERLGCARVVILVIGWEVPHVHVHLIPTNVITDVGMPPEVKVTPEEMSALAAKLGD
jgi:histidine triad (HIT) family protein